MNTRDWFKVRLATFRCNEGLSQAEIAKAAKVSGPFISMLERGEREPTLDFILLVASKFKVSADYLLGRKDEPAFGNRKRKSCKEIGREIRALREKLDIPQYIFADSIHLNRRTLTAIETGTGRLKIKSAILLIEKYELSFDDFFFRSITK